MLPFDFDYFKPASLKEALDLFQTFDHQGKHPSFFSGGTELITLGRIDLAYADAVIDLKGIPECRVMGMNGDDLVLGSALSLLELEEANLFPLLTKTASEVADHTARAKITLGGNICAQIFYRETVLPFLLGDSRVVIAGPTGIRMVPIRDIFLEQLRLDRGEILVQLITEKRFLEAPFISVKRRQQWDIGYPLITLNALNMEGNWRVAISGYCPFPFRSQEAEIMLNHSGISIEDRVNRAVAEMPSGVLNDVEGSAEYRKFVLRNLLRDVLTAHEGGEM